MIIHSYDNSLIYQFNMCYYDDLPRYLALKSEKIFLLFEDDKFIFVAEKVSTAFVTDLVATFEKNMYFI